MKVTIDHNVDPRQARMHTQELMAARVRADYFGYQELSEHTARRLLQNSLAIRNVLKATARQHMNVTIDIRARSR